MAYMMAKHGCTGRRSAGMPGKASSGERAMAFVEHRRQPQCTNVARRGPLQCIAGRSGQKMGWVRGRKGHEWQLRGCICECGEATII
jgi:hypothetical protein